jgi:peptide/nickel transport system ATP-binding protein
VYVEIAPGAEPTGGPGFGDLACEARIEAVEPASGRRERYYRGRDVKPHHLARLLDGAGLGDRLGELRECVEHAYGRPIDGALPGGAAGWSIARALAVEPQFIVADEPVSALDVSIQAQVINLLSDLRERFDLTMLFISHDLDVVEYLCDRIVVLYLGKVMEVAPAKALYETPKHPYTEALLEASPRPDPEARRGRRLLEGDIPSPVDPPSGCVFRTRCPYALPACAATVPALREVAPGRFKACIRDDVL